MTEVDFEVPREVGDDIVIAAIDESISASGLCVELKIADSARGLKVTRKHLSAIVNGRSSVTPDMALRLAKAFGGSARSWLNMQQAHDLWHATQRADLSEVQVLQTRERELAQ